MTITSGYQDAWNTAGWTAQWGYLPNATPGTSFWADGTPPEGLSILYITGTWNDQWGGANGSLLFVPTSREVNFGGTIVNLVPFRILLQGGHLPAGFGVPSPDLSVVTVPDMWDWKISGRIGDQSVSWTVKVPNFAGTIDLNALSGDYFLDGGQANTDDFVTDLDGGSA